jgi:WD40 repeat protein
VTALSFDKNERRLVTAANDACIRMWNFNNGSLLRT